MEKCKNGHLKSEFGVYSGNKCKKCASDSYKEKYRRSAEFREKCKLRTKSNRISRAKTKDDWFELDKIRFMSYVDKGGENGCWNWKSNVLKTGYGSFSAKRSFQKTFRAHRFSWLIHGKALEDGKDLCHSCDNRLCVNPDHLWLGTRQENLLDCKAKGRNPIWEKTHCKHGHEYTEQNTIIRFDGYRECRICSNETKKRYCMRKKNDSAFKESNGRKSENRKLEKFS